MVAPPRGEGGVPRPAPYCGEGEVPRPAKMIKTGQIRGEVVGQNKSRILIFFSTEGTNVGTIL